VECAISRRANAAVIWGSRLPTKAPKRPVSRCGGQSPKRTGGLVDGDPVPAQLDKARLRQEGGKAAAWPRQTLLVISTNFPPPDERERVDLPAPTAYFPPPDPRDRLGSPDPLSSDPAERTPEERRARWNTITRWALSGFGMVVTATVVVGSVHGGITGEPRDKNRAPTPCVDAWNDPSNGRVRAQFNRVMRAALGTPRQQMSLKQVDSSCTLGAVLPTGTGLLWVETSNGWLRQKVPPVDPMYKHAAAALVAPNVRAVIRPNARLATDPVIGSVEHLEP
jgi:hypothetical protein